MDHRAFLRSLPAEDRRALTQTSDVPGLVRLSGHLGAIVALGTAIAMGVPGWQGLLVLQGILIIFLFTLLHETTHKTPFKSGWLNTAAGWISGLAVVLPPDWFRQFHMAHHRYTQDPEKDPELLYGGEPTTWKAYAWAVTGVPVWISHFKTVFKNAAGQCHDGFVPQARRGHVQREAWIMIAVYGTAIGMSVVLQSDLLLWTLVVPAVLGQPFLRLYLMAEHGRCPFVADMFENTRTTMTNRFVRWVAWNMPYHTEHHAYPTVPFHKLPHLHGLMQPHLKQVQEDGYSGFHRALQRDLHKNLTAGAGPAQ